MLQGLRRAAKKGGRIRTNDSRMTERGRIFGRTPGIGQRIRFTPPPPRKGSVQ